MDRKTRKRTLELLEGKAAGSGRSYSDIALETGHGERRLKRMARQLAEGGAEAAARHGNSGRTPANAASPGELEVLRGLKRSYPSVTIAHFRDTHVEDVLGDPRRAGEAGELGLVERSRSWFRNLFEREGRVSPARRRPLRDPDGRTRPPRPPLPREGMMAQIDAAPDDWLGDGRARAPRVAVDDATPEPLAGWLVPTGCLRGCARMARETPLRHGAPACAHADKDPVFRSAKDGSPTQFAAMLSDLGVRLIFANTPQAKGRAGRHDRTTRLGLAVDLRRFGVTSYDETDPRLDGFYAPYLNAKFSYRPSDPAGGFRPLPEGTDLSRALRVREPGVASGGVISYRSSLYAAVDGDGVLLDPVDGERVGVFTDAITEEFYAEARGRRWSLVEVGQRLGRGPAAARDRREAASLVEAMTRDGGIRARGDIFAWR